MRRGIALICLFGVLALGATPAAAAPPTVGPPSATNLQGVSALLRASVDPEGLATTYRFEYGASGPCAVSSCLSAASQSAGSGSSPVPARLAVSGLTPDTTYHYRLVATNASGTVAGADATFATTGGFGFKAGSEGFAARAIADGDGAATLAGSHPYALSFGIGFKAGGEFEGQPGTVFPDGDLRRLRIALPPGLLLNSEALGYCEATEFNMPRISPYEESRSGESCPARSQVGTVELQTAAAGGEPRRFGLFNLDPAPGRPAQLGFAPYGRPIVLDGRLEARSDGRYALALEANEFPQALDVSGLQLELWGIPWAASHNGERGNCLNEAEPSFPWAKCQVGEPEGSPPLAYLTMPATCSDEIAFTASASAWQQPSTVTRQVLNRDSGGDPAPVEDCTSLDFEPETHAFLTTTKASTGSGFNFQLTADGNGLTKPSGRAPSPARSVTVALPEGVSVNPSVGAGLGSCSRTGFAAETATSAPGAGCPSAAKIGDFRVRSPLFAEWLEGAIYLATPDNPETTAPGTENPFDTLVAAYLVAKQPERGAIVKSAGKILADPVSGNLTGVFDNLPELPYTDLNLTFRPGQRAFLVSPPSCGQAITRIQMSPWSGSPGISVFNSSAIDSGIEARPCPTGGALPFAPGAVAGGVNSNVGSYTPYFVHLTRRDTEQEITSYSLVLPKGITAKLAGIPFCGEAAIARSRARRGAAEAADPSCPAASQVGHTLTGYGVGAGLTYASGRIYLAGPYHGSPLSLVTVNSATVGPFDLGTIVIRSAFDLDKRTAQLQIDSRASDPIPHILEGIPLHLRDVRIYMDRPEFTHNPSSCEPSQLVSTLTGAGTRLGDPSDDSTATATKHFQLLNCLELGFRPRLGLRLRGGSRRGAYPSLRATFAARGPQDSNLKRIEVTMPHSIFLAQNHIRTICTVPQFDAESCPAGSVYGRAVAHTPLFDEPLRGDVYLRSAPGRPLPDLVASLRSGSVHIVVEGRIGPAKQGIRALFDGLPDAPIERFTMTLYGGKRGLLTNSSNICASPPRSTVRALGQNNVGAVFTTRLRGQCKKKGKSRQNGRGKAKQKQGGRR